MVELYSSSIVTRPGVNRNSMANGYRITFGNPVGWHVSEFDRRPCARAACMTAYSAVSTGAIGSRGSRRRGVSSMKVSRGTTQTPAQSSDAGG
jgi:hypothetical protein